jgi:hypothetical protein
MTTYPQFKCLIDDLVQAAYDSGYYSGQHEDGSPPHREAINRRGYLRGLALAAYKQLCEDLDDLYPLVDES